MSPYTTKSSKLNNHPRILNFSWRPASPGCAPPPQSHPSHSVVLSRPRAEEMVIPQGPKAARAPKPREWPTSSASAGVTPSAEVQRTPGPCVWSPRTSMGSLSRHVRQRQLVVRLRWLSLIFLLFTHRHLIRSLCNMRQYWFIFRSLLIDLGKYAVRYSSSKILESRVLKWRRNCVDNVSDIL